MAGHGGICRTLAVLGPCLIFVASARAEPGMWDGKLTPAQAPAGPGQPASPAPPIARPAGSPAPFIGPGTTTPTVQPAPLGLAGQTFGAPAFGGARPSGPSLTSLERFPLVGIPQMLGDQSPIVGPAEVAPAPSGGNTVRLPWVRGYKMADNQSPWPIDRVFVASYYYDDLNFGASQLVRDIRVWRQFFGFEKTFLDGSSSIGLRLPLNTISAESRVPGVGGTSTSLGDMTVFLKHALWQDPARGDVFSLGFAVTPPTGPAAFAGADFAVARNPTYLQPFVGYVKTFGPRLYVQGFTGINVPTDSRVVTMLYNDLGVGYFLHRAEDPDAWLTALVPSMEVHVNTPLNHRGGFSDVGDPGATIDAVNLTFGLSATLRSRTALSAGFVTPVTGPHPFEFEVVALLNIYFGGPRRAPRPSVPPAFGG